MKYTNIRIRRMFICIGITKHWRLSVVQVRKVDWLLEFSLSTRGERDTQFLLCWLFHLTQQTRGASRSPTGLASPRLKNQLASPRFKSQLVSPSVESQLTAFLKNHQNSQPLASGHSHPSHISYLGFLLWHLWLSHPPRASVNCTQCVHLHVH